MPHKFFWTVAVLAAISFALLQITTAREESYILDNQEQAGKVLDRPSKASGRADIGGNFSLITHEGNPVTDQDFIGKPTLVFFGFTHCPAICPTDLAVLSNVLEQLGDESNKVNVLFVTVDPQRDTVEKLKNYMKDFHSSIIALTGTDEQLKEAAEGYKIFARKIENPMMEGYMFDHSAYTYLMDKKGEYVTHFNHDSDPDAIISRLRQQF